MENKQFLNLGCGATFSESWTNLDFVSLSPHVKQYNLLKGIPFGDNKFEFVYHSHVLEHFPKSEAENFIRECFRVLKPGATLRVVVPDLEQIALNYIKYLNEAVNGIEEAEKKYEWTMLELFDQVVRSKTGGEMLDYIKDISKNNDKFLLERNGKEAELLINNLRVQKSDAIDSRSGARKFLSSVYHFNFRSKMEKWVLRENHDLYLKAKFRSEGEIHQWMYDRYSLKKLLEKCGFRNIVKQSAFSSALVNWCEFNLDGTNGIVRKPDLLFMEATK